MSTTSLPGRLHVTSSPAEVCLGFLGNPAEVFTGPPALLPVAQKIASRWAAWEELDDLCRTAEILGMSSLATDAVRSLLAGCQSDRRPE